MINQNSPLQPLGTQTTDYQLANYRARYTQLVQSLNDQAPTMPETINPFMPDTQNIQKSQDKYRQDLAQFLAPVDRPDPERSQDYHSKRQANLQHHIDNHPVMKKIGPQVTEKANELLALYQSGMSLQDVTDLFADWADQNVEPVIDKYTNGRESINLLSDIKKPTPKLLGGNQGGLNV